jgi:hypothetical protein
MVIEARGFSELALIGKKRVGTVLQGVCIQLISYISKVQIIKLMPYTE